MGNKSSTGINNSYIEPTQLAPIVIAKTNENQESNTVKQNYEKVDLSLFNDLPGEIQLYTLSFIPMQNLTDLLLISKSMNEEIKKHDEIHRVFYADFRKRAVVEKRDWNSRNSGWSHYDDYDYSIIPVTLSINISSTNQPLGVEDKPNAVEIEEFFDLPLRLDTFKNSHSLETGYVQLKYVANNHIQNRMDQIMNSSRNEGVKPC